jgi:hypothetical protein
MAQSAELPTARQLRMLAVEVLAIADQMNDPHFKRIMIAIAASYERLAEHAAKREAEAPEH